MLQLEFTLLTSIQNYEQAQSCQCVNKTFLTSVMIRINRDTRNFDRKLYEQIQVHLSHNPNGLHKTFCVQGPRVLYLVVDSQPMYAL